MNIKDLVIALHNDNPTYADRKAANKRAYDKRTNDNRRKLETSKLIASAVPLLSAKFGGIK